MSFFPREMVGVAALLASLRAVATTFTLASGGCVLRARGVMTNEVSKGLSKISMTLTIPALLFTTAINCEQDWSHVKCPSLMSSLKKGWPLLLLPAVYVSVGCAVGAAAAKLGGATEGFRRIAIAAVAFGNSTGLPMTLLTAVATQASLSKKDDDDEGPPLGKTNILLYLSVYLLTYPIFQWTIGSYLMSGDDEILSPLRGENDEEMRRKYFFQEESSPSSSANTTTRVVSSSSLADDDMEEPLVLAPFEEEETQEKQSFLFLPPSLSRASCFPLSSRLLPPPVIAAILGMGVAVCLPVRAFLVDLEDRDDDAPLEWFFDGLQTIGRAAVPLNMFVLGNSLSKGWKRQGKSQVPRRARYAVAFAKLVIMPSIGALIGLFLRTFIAEPAPLLVAMVVSCTPTANNLMVMAELKADANKDALAATIFVQYLIAPITLSFWLTVFLLIANGQHL